MADRLYSPGLSIRSYSTTSPVQSIIGNRESCIVNQSNACVRRGAEKAAHRLSALIIYACVALVHAAWPSSLCSLFCMSGHEDPPVHSGRAVTAIYAPT